MEGNEARRKSRNHYNLSLRDTWCCCCCCCLCGCRDTVTLHRHALSALKRAHLLIRGEQRRSTRKRRERQHGKDSLDAIFCLCGTLLVITSLRSKAALCVFLFPIPNYFSYLFHPLRCFVLSFSVKILS